MYCQVKDITCLGDRTCHKCNSEIMETIHDIQNQLLVLYSSVCSC